MRLANPAWVDKALTRSWALFEARTPPIVTPRKRSRRGAFHPKGPVTLHADELGCGHYGCVLQTPDPAVVVKLTTDHSEAAFVKLLLARGLHEPGLVRYREIVRLPSEHKGLPIYAIWREAAEDVGGVFTCRYDVYVFGRAGTCEDVDRFASHLMRFKLAANCVRNLLLPQRGARGVRDVFLWGLLEAARHVTREAAELVYVNDETGVVAWDSAPYGPGKMETDVAACLLACGRAAEMMAETVAGRLIGRTLLALIQQGMLLTDVHAGNIGRVERDGERVVVVTDPGHMLPLAREIARASPPELPRRPRQPNP